MMAAGGPNQEAMIARRTEAAEGLAFARAWRARLYPVAVREPMPFRGHRSCAAWSEAE